MAASDAVGGTAVARAEVRNSLDRLEYHLGRGARGAKGVRREVAYLDALHRQTVRMGGVAAGRAYVATPLESFGEKAVSGLSGADGRSVSRMKSSILADFSADGLQPAREWTKSGDPWKWTANGSACPTCLARHGQALRGPFVPAHPSCLCIPTPVTLVRSADGFTTTGEDIRPLTKDELISTAREYGNPRYFRKLDDFEAGTIGFSDIAALENINESAKGLAAVNKHLLKSEVRQTSLPGSGGGTRRVKRADPDTSPTTADYWTDESGAYLPERERLHDSIVRKFIDDVDPGDPPEFQMMGGGPASGKSTMLEAPDSPVLRGRAAVQIDTDEIKKLLPEYDDMVKAGDDRAAAFAHQESSYVSKRILREAGDDLSVVLDGTGDGGWQSVQGKIAPARARGQKVTANYATNDVELASRLSYERGLKTGRAVPDDVLRNIHADVTDTFFDSLERGLFDDAFLVDTNILGNPRAVVTFKNGRLVIDDEDLLKDFLAKSHRTGARTVDDVKAMARTFDEAADAADAAGDGVKATDYVSKKFTDRKAKEYATDRKDFLVDAGLSEDEVAALWQKALDEATVNVNISEANLAKVLDDGRFKTQFETNSSGGTLDSTWRSEAEERMFGVAKDQAPAERAIYGWVGEAERDGAVSWYGNTVVVMKPSIKDATTVTFGDSLGAAYAPSPIKSINPKAGFNWRGINEYSYNHNLVKRADLSDIPGGSYPEVQIHGGQATVENIGEVIFRQQPTQAIRNRLEKAEIPWRIVERR